MILNKLQKFLAARLFTTLNDVQLIKKQLTTIFEQAQASDLFSKRLLGDYFFYGKEMRMQLYALQLLLKLINVKNKDFIEYFEHNLSLINSPYYRYAKHYSMIGNHLFPDSPLAGYFSHMSSFNEEIIHLSGEGYLKIHDKNLDAVPIHLLINHQFSSERPENTFQEIYPACQFFLAYQVEVIQEVLDKLKDLAMTGDLFAKRLLGDYAYYGMNNKLQVYALKHLVQVVAQNDQEFLPYFERNFKAFGRGYYKRAKEYLLSAKSKPADAQLEIFFDPIVSFNHAMIQLGFEGYLKILGREAYPFFVEFICNAENPLENRGNAILNLSTHCKIPFGQGLDYSKIKDDTLFRIKEILEWAEKGFPELLIKKRKIVQDTGIKKPTTRLEKIAQKLNKMNRKNGGLGLNKADLEDMKKILSLWKLPSLYQEFLERFSPDPLCFEVKQLDLGISLIGANSLIQEQSGFAFKSPSAWNDKLERFPEWPENLLVVANEVEGAGDVFVMDLAKSNGTDAPLYFMPHDDPESRTLVADSFLDFLEKIAVGKGIFEIILGDYFDQAVKDSLEL